MSAPFAEYGELPPLPPQFLNKAADATPEFVENGFLVFWSAYRNYLASRGYTLYETIEIDGLNDYRPVSVSPPPYAHPYAIVYYDASDRLDLDTPSVLHFYAQDALDQHVVLKSVLHNSDEYRIYTLLSACPELRQLEAFPSVIPTLDIIPTPHDFSFVVTPRWGPAPISPGVISVRELLFFIESILRGLTFLHEHRIVHRDIDWKNTLINHFSHNGYFSRRDKSSYRASPQAQYCLFDFDLSLIVPAGVGRLPSALATVGSPYNHPQDINQGEFDYDPFAYDVASMGNMLARFDYATPAVPLLAPLLDRMTTHIVARRFTASEALKFCGFIKESLSPEELDTRLDPEPRRNGYHPDRWARLPPDFLRTWSAYRESPPSFRIRFLRWITYWNSGWRLLRFIRRFLRI